MIDEMRENISESVYKQIGMTNAKKITVSDLIKEVEQVSDKYFTDENFNNLMSFLSKNENLLSFKDCKKLSSKK